MGKVVHFEIPPTDPGVGIHCYFKDLSGFIHGAIQLEIKTY